ncbi:MAG: DUF4440 domain-containing protein [Blastocatellia bacterium]
MKRATFAMTLVIAATVIVSGQTNNQPPKQDDKTEQEVKAFRLDLREAHKRRDRAALERMIADDFIFIHSTGNWETRQEYIENAAAGALNSQRPGLEFEGVDEPIRVYEGHTAMVSGRGVVRDRSRNTENHGRGVDVFAKIAGRWRWVLHQSTRLAPRPKGAAVDSRIYEAYVGQYEISAGRTFTVLKEGDGLRAQTTGRAPGELIPKSETEFIWFNPELNVPGVAEVTFIKDEAGKVTHAVFRRDGQEMWRAKKTK